MRAAADVRKTTKGSMEMEVRKLEQNEHIKTRALWERVFSEDTKEFLDYYYTVKTKDNEIFVMEDEDKIVGMMQLNPYHLRVNENVCPANYIIAVATDERYRKRGIMASLLKTAMREMYERKEPFTFLMPAAEAIYYPFDFRFVYGQNQGVVCGRKGEQGSLAIIHAEEKDCAVIAEFANQFLKEYQVVANRDAGYYQTLIAEQESESGGVVMAMRQNQLAGIFCYAKGEDYEIREPLFFDSADFEQAVCELTQREAEPVKCVGYGNERQVPMIMVRILHIETFLKSFSLKEDLDFCVRIHDKLLEKNDGVFRIAGSREQGISQAEKIEGSEEVVGEITIGDLTSVLFGYLPMEELDIEASLKSPLGKICPMSKVFLNEVV